ncbi:MAG: threonine ammonia-lyase [Actinobacteria bacterium]|nr:threonine ammonia-lyase [Actinomycetota bacterium]
MTDVTLKDIEAAAEAIDGAVLRTPSARSATLSDVLGAQVILKFEIFQFTAAYKERGARNRLLALSDAERSAGVVAVSAGNHGQAVAHHARLLGIPATVVMPKGTPFVKVARTRHLGAEVEMFGETLEEAMERGMDLVKEGRTFVHPYNDPIVIAGQGTVALELLDDHPEIDTLVVPVGGGGLIAGVAAAAAGMRPDVRVVGVQTERYPSMARALKGDATPVPGGPTIAEGIAVAKAADFTARIIRELRAELITVTEEAIVEAVNLLLEIEKVVVEGAGAAGIAAMLEHGELFAGRTVGVILSGGNIDPRRPASIIHRGLVKGARLSRLRVALDDRPGALAQLLSIVGEVGANVLEVQHQRIFADTPIRSVDVDLAIETFDEEHRDVVVAAIREAGYRVLVVPLDAV